MSKKDLLTKFEEKVAEIFGKLDAHTERQRAKLRPKKVQGVTYANLNDRVFASVIDVCLSFVLVAPILVGLSNIIYNNQRSDPLAGLHPNATPAEMIAHLQASNFFNNLMVDYLMHFVVFGIIILWLWNISACTPGKWLLRMRIVDADTFCKPMPAQLLKRYGGYVVSMLPLTLGFFWVALDKKNRGWHDMFANTVVVKVKHWRFKDDGTTPHINVAALKKDDSD